MSHFLALGGWRIVGGADSAGWAAAVPLSVDMEYGALGRLPASPLPLPSAAAAGAAGPARMDPGTYAPYPALIFRAGAPPAAAGSVPSFAAVAPAAAAGAATAAAVAAPASEPDADVAPLCLPLPAEPVDDCGAAAKA